MSMSYYNMVCPVCAFNGKEYYSNRLYINSYSLSDHYCNEDDKKKFIPVSFEKSDQDQISILIRKPIRISFYLIIPTGWNISHYHEYDNFFVYLDLNENPIISEKVKIENEEDLKIINNKIIEHYASIYKNSMFA